VTIKDTVLSEEGRRINSLGHVSTEIDNCWLVGIKRFLAWRQY